MPATCPCPAPSPPWTARHYQWRAVWQCGTMALSHQWLCRMTLALNPSDSGPNITLSNNNLTATSSGATETWRSIRTTQNLSAAASTKIYFEVAVSSTAGGYIMICFGNASANINSYIGSDSNGIGLQALNSSWDVYYNGGNSGQVATVAGVNIPIPICVDTVANQYWIYDYVRGTWNAVQHIYPELSAGQSIAATGPLYIGCAFYGNASDNVSATFTFVAAQCTFNTPYGFTDFYGNTKVPGTLPGTPRSYWNPADTTNVLIGDNYLQASAGGNSAQTVWNAIRSNTSYSSASAVTLIEAALMSKYLVGPPGSFSPYGQVMNLGIVNASMALTTYPGADANGIGLQLSGVAQPIALWQNGAYNVIEQYGGDAILICIDTVNKKFWYRVIGGSSGAWNGNVSATPTAPTTGIDISGIAQPWYLCASFQGPQSTESSCVTDFKMANYTVISTYTPWDNGSSPPPPSGAGFPIVINPPIWAPSMPCFELPCGAQGYYRQIGYWRGRRNRRRKLLHGNKFTRIVGR